MEWICAEDLIKPKDTMIIYYEWWAGNCNMGFWTGELNGKIYDYNTKDFLIKSAKQIRDGYMVLRYGKGKKRGMVMIVQHEPKK